MENAEQEFERIYESTKRQVMRYIAAHCFDISDIEDLFQDTYLSVYRSVTNMTERIESDEAFAINAAKWVLSRHYSVLRKLRAKLSITIDRQTEKNVAADIPDSVDVEKLAVDRELLDEIFATVTEMPIVWQRVFYMRYVLDMTAAEIGNKLDLSESSVRQKISRVLFDIRRLYKRREQE